MVLLEGGLPDVSCFCIPQPSRPAATLTLLYFCISIFGKSIFMHSPICKYTNHLFCRVYGWTYRTSAHFHLSCIWPQLSSIKNQILQLPPPPLPWVSRMMSMSGWGNCFQKMKSQYENCRERPDFGQRTMFKGCWSEILILVAIPNKRTALLAKCTKSYIWNEDIHLWWLAGGGRWQSWVEGKLCFVITLGYPTLLHYRAGAYLGNRSGISIQHQHHLVRTPCDTFFCTLSFKLVLNITRN